MCSTGKILSVACALLALGLPSQANSFECITGPFIIFFDSDIAYVDEEARNILDRVSRLAATCGYGRTVIEGHADTRENPELGRKRAKVVRAYLAGHGIPEDDIDIKARGASRQRIATGANVAERQNRRVEISFHPIFAPLPAKARAKSQP